MFFGIHFGCRSILTHSNVVVTVCRRTVLYVESICRTQSESLKRFRVIQFDHGRNFSDAQVSFLPTATRARDVRVVQNTVVSQSSNLSRSLHFIMLADGDMYSPADLLETPPAATRGATRT